MKSAVSAKSLVKKFGDFVAVDNTSFEIRPGETFGILGENGAGKSTTMRMIACRSPLSDGELFVEGFDVKTQERKIRTILGIVPQENNLDPDLNVLENLLVYARYFRMDAEIAKQRSEELLNFVGLQHKLYAKVEHLSGGMKRRLIIARALLHRPGILLLDEPTTGLDPNVRQEIWDKLEELRRNENLTILLSTHYMDEAEKLCQRIIVMAHGKIIAEGVPAELIGKTLKKFALEIREALETDAIKKENILFLKRGSAHLYFADDAETLTSLMPHYGTRPMLLRPTNLEDVFLQLVEK